MLSHSSLLFGIFCGCRGFRHRTETDLFLFLLNLKNKIDPPAINYIDLE